MSRGIFDFRLPFDVLRAVSEVERTIDDWEPGQAKSVAAVDEEIAEDAR